MNLSTLRGRAWRRRLPICLIALFLVPACEQSRQASTVPPVSSSPLIQIDFTIHYAGHKPDIRLETMQVSAGATVFDALQTAGEQCRFGILSQGSGPMLFVSAINEVANEGASGDNWTYRVNGELGNSSAGTFELSPNDQVEWSLGDYPVK